MRSFLIFFHVCLAVINAGIGFSGNPDITLSYGLNIPMMIATAASLMVVLMATGEV